VTLRCVPLGPHYFADLAQRAPSVLTADPDDECMFFAPTLFNKRMSNIPYAYTNCTRYVYLPGMGMGMGWAI